LLFVGCRQHASMDRGGLQTLTPITTLPTDSVVLTRLRAAHPCVEVASALSSRQDSMPPAVRCTLVATAVDAIRALNGAPKIITALQRFRTDSVRCVTVREEAYRNDATGTLDIAQWTVEFLSDRQPSLAVEINRLTGEARAFRTLDEFGFTAEQMCARVI
jgi:hypothetical protein